MATCDLGYEHEDPASEPEPAEVIVAPDPGPNENDVKIAEIEAGASIEREKIYAEENKDELALEVEALRGELRGVKETLATLAPPPPEPEPEIIPVPAPPSEPAPEPAAPVPPAAEPPKQQKKSGFWGPAYH